MEVSSLDDTATFCFLSRYILVTSSDHINSTSVLLCRPFLDLQVLQKAYFMPESSNRKQVFLTYGQMMQLFDEMERKNFSEWNQSLDMQYLKRLERPLMVRCRDNSAKLEINFDKWVTQTLPVTLCYTAVCVLLTLCVASIEL